MMGTHEKPSIVFHHWPQARAQFHFRNILSPYLPESNPLYNRILSPENTPSRHCLFAATFPPPPSNGSPPVAPCSASFTILFADRSRQHESQVWLFNPLSTSALLSAADEHLLGTHMERAMLFLRDTAIPDTPDRPSFAVLRIACLHAALAAPLVAFARRHSALARCTEWDAYVSRLDALPAVCPPIPELWAFGDVPEDQVALVLATSEIPRQASTLRALPNVALFNTDGRMCAWAYVGIDCSFATLYVLPEYRRRGLASAVGWMLLTKLRDGKFAVSYTVSDQGMEFQVHAYQGGKGGSNYVQADIDPENVGSKKVLEKLGLKALWRSSYIWVDSYKVP